MLTEISSHYHNSTHQTNHPEYIAYIYINNAAQTLINWSN